MVYLSAQVMLMTSSIAATSFWIALIFFGISRNSVRSSISPSIDDVNISAILDSVIVSYDKRVRPNYGGTPVEVGVTMYVLSISSLSEVKMDFTLDFYFRQFWTDPRLAFQKQPGIETLSVGSEFLKNIWVPDTFFVNEKTSYFHTVTTNNEFIRISSMGKITRSMRLTITASCPMNLEYFPMDRQLCTIEIESFGYTMKDIIYEWGSTAKGSVGISQSVQLPQFKVLGHRQRSTKVTLSTVGYTMRDIRYKWNEGETSVGVSNEVSLPQFKVLGHRQKTFEISLTTGNYSRLACEIQFVRSMGYYLIQIYIPSGLIVIISWVSFWLNRNATPARVSLGVTTVLTMTTLMSSTNAALPKISYVKSIDVYLGTCFVMVFASLLEYATVGYLGKRIQMRKSRNQNLQKLAEKKRNEELELSTRGPGGGGNSHGHGGHGHHHGHGHHNYPNPPRGFGNHAQYSNTYSHQFAHPHHNMYAEQNIPKQTEVRYNPNSHFKGGGMLLENTVRNRENSQGGGDDEGITATGPCTILRGHRSGKNLNKMYGLTPSDIDKYSRIIFPVCFICFNLMYWILYLHISDVVVEGLVRIEDSV